MTALDSYWQTYKNGDKRERNYRALRIQQSIISKIIEWLINAVISIIAVRRDLTIARVITYNVIIWNDIISVLRARGTEINTGTKFVASTTGTTRLFVTHWRETRVYTWCTIMHTRIYQSVIFFVRINAAGFIYIYIFTSAWCVNRFIAMAMA